MQVLALVGENVAPAFRIAGMEVISPNSYEEVQKIFHQILLREDLAMLVISVRFSLMLKKEINEHRISRHPLVVLEISSSQGNYNAGQKLMQHIKKVIGQG